MARGSWKSTMNLYKEAGEAMSNFLEEAGRKKWPTIIWKIENILSGYEELLNEIFFFLVKYS